MTTIDTTVNIVNSLERSATFISFALFKINSKLRIKFASRHRPAKHPSEPQAVYRTLNSALPQCSKIQQDECEDFEIPVCRVLISPTFQSSSHPEHHCWDQIKTGKTLRNTERWQCVCKRGS